MRVALCQLNSKVGDLEGNSSKIRAWYREAVDRGADLVVFPELALTGYPPRDLIDLVDFMSRTHRMVDDLAGQTGAAGLLFGAPVESPTPQGKRHLNAAVLAHRGKVRHRIGKKLLPIYDVFDEARNFAPDENPAAPVEFMGMHLGIHVCEDAWNEEGFWPRRMYLRDPVRELAGNGAQILINISASPFHQKKFLIRRSIFRSHCKSNNLAYLYTNAVGGNDELVFDGEAYVFDREGELLATGNPFREEIHLVDIDPGSPGFPKPLLSWSPGNPDRTSPSRVRSELDEVDAVYQALLLGLRDYAAKCGFSSAVLGLSGGIDSALTAVLAAEALGPQNVLAVAMPSRYSSKGSLTDAEELAQNLDLRYEVLPIETPFQGTLDVLAPLFSGTAPDLAEENIQARVRGMLLMALSNKFGHLLLSTGNKSELAVGYCTLYGDMAGGLAVISDVPKTLVYRLARTLNRDGIRIPESTITKAPSAELRPDQRDEDSLPPYVELDGILEGYIEEGASMEALVSRGFARETVAWVIERVTRAEYKRRQAAPGIKISPKAFGTGRRMPIANGWPQ